MCVVVCLSVRFLVGIFRGPVTPHQIQGAGLPQQSLSLRFNGDSVLPYPLRRSFDYYHFILVSPFCIKVVHSDTATLSALLDGGRHSVNGLLVCILIPRLHLCMRVNLLKRLFSRP